MDIKQRAIELIEQENLKVNNELSKIEETSENNLPANISSKNTLQSLQEEYINTRIKNGASLNEITSDFAKATTTTDIMNDDSDEGEKYREDLKKEQKKILKESFKQDKIKGENETLQEKQKKAETFYTAFRPILEFDFDNLIKRKDSKDEKPKKNYQDRSYGITLMVFMLILLTPFYCAVTIILASLNGLNSILEQINTFGKVARYIALSILIIFFVILIIYGSILGIENLFNVDIINF